ncbi:type VI secretion system contractile sheath small subunit [Sulfidibacter corallicola]|uniref:Type VI secretion system contractile sheath small subunit n=1 Tax=Sulfidibacter corallicola TaxID=2818388 RepID=A0A8A4TV28_SULCO|nr:type VI secretion system contractile sheath small subunit [Sulfidibacter corallicola]QTD53380.1 type VI secretion system contractile sheath small subunit [Sulfidibacter corallicola]
MARGSYQDEIPPSRVNIKYVKYVGDAKEEVELPLKLLLLGDYTMREDDTPLEERKKISVNKNNFASVMKEQKLGLNINVANKLSGEEGDEMKVDLKFDSIDDFNPENIAQQMPETRMLLEVRKLLMDLKGRVVNNSEFRKELNRIVGDPSKIDALRSQLDQLAPLLQPKEDEA